MLYSKHPFFVCVFVASLGIALAAAGQGTRADYERANQLRRLTENKVFRAQVKPHWFADNKRFWYRNDLSAGRREFVVVDAENRPIGIIDSQDLARIRLV